VRKCAYMLCVCSSPSWNSVAGCLSIMKGANSSDAGISSFCLLHLPHHPVPQDTWLKKEQSCQEKTCLKLIPNHLNLHHFVAHGLTFLPTCIMADATAKKAIDLHVTTLDLLLGYFLPPTLPSSAYTPCLPSY